MNDQSERDARARKLHEQAGRAGEAYAQLMAVADAARVELGASVVLVSVLRFDEDGAAVVDTVTSPPPHSARLLTLLAGVARFAVEIWAARGS